MNELIHTPCDCPPGWCPHYNRLLTGNLHKYTHTPGALGEKYRRRWLGAPVVMRETTPMRPCGSCGKNNDLLVNHTGAGLGDALLGLCAVAGLKADHPDKNITYRVHADAIPFVELFDAGYARLAVHDFFHDGETPPTKDIQMNTGYDVEVKERGRTPRWERYRANIGASEVKLPDLRDRAALVELGKEFDGCIVLAPFSTYRDREYPLRAWVDLATILKSKGYRPVVMSNTPSRTEAFPCEKVIGERAEVVAGIVLNSLVTVGNDSGLAHLAGIMAKPTIALCGQTQGQQIFGLYPSVVSIQGKLSCTGCYWQGPWEKDTCGSSCATLQSITVADILRAVDEIALPIYSGGRACCSTNKLAMIRDMVLDTNHLDGDVGELGVWKGGSAKIIARYSTHGKVRLWDTFCGMPMNDRDGFHEAGDFDDTSLDEVKAFLHDPACIYHEGIFPMPIYGEGKYRFVHIDADTYQSTLSACIYFRDRMTPGGVLLFDDYGFWRTPGVQRAFHEIYGNNYHRMGEYQVAVRF